MSNYRALGVVRWFDSLSQEGVIRVNGKSIFYCNNAFQCSGFKDETREKLESGQVVFVEVIEDSHYTQVSRIIDSKGM